MQPVITLPPVRRLLLALVLLGLASGFVLGPLAWDGPAALVAAIVATDLVRGSAVAYWASTSSRCSRLRGPSPCESTSRP